LEYHIAQNSFDKNRVLRLITNPDPENIFQPKGEESGNSNIVNAKWVWPDAKRLFLGMIIFALGAGLLANSKHADCAFHR
jgi:hypothetical protein